MGGHKGLEKGWFPVIGGRLYYTSILPMVGVDPISWGVGYTNNEGIVRGNDSQPPFGHQIAGDRLNSSLAVFLVI